MTSNREGSPRFLTVYAEAAVCGRFQPPHREHIEYMTRALERCEFLWIGLVVRFGRKDHADSGAAPHRWYPEANPLSYAERSAIIREALLDSGVSRGRFGFVPFPLDEPDLLGEYVDLRTPILVSHCDRWSDEKQGRLEGAGYAVEVLFERPPTRVEGRTIRNEIIAGTQGWELLVPEATKKAVVLLRLRDRLLRLAAHSTGGHTAQPEIASDGAPRRG